MFGALLSVLITLGLFGLLGSTVTTTNTPTLLERNLNHQRSMRAGQTGDRLIGVMLVIVIAAAIGYVGVDVVSEINDSIDVESGSNFDFAQDNLSTGFTDAMGLTDIVFIVLMFSVILGALLAFRVRT